MAEFSPQEIRKSLSTTAKSFKDYWRVYGGWKDAVCSAYSFVAFAFTLVVSPAYLFSAWWEPSIDILPNIVGFTIGAYAILVSFGDEKFRKVLAASRKKTEDSETPPSSLAEHLQQRPSPFMAVNAAFAHMVIVQSLAIVFAVIGSVFDFVMPVELSKSEDFNPLMLLTVPFSFISVFFFAYGMALIFAATLNIFRVAAWWDYSQTIEADNQNERTKADD